jgi:hypothetical protein
MTDIVYALMESLRAHLESKLVTSPPSWVQEMLTVPIGSTPTYIPPTFIKIGRVYDPIDEGVPGEGLPFVQIAIHANDPDDLSDGWEHAILSAIPFSKENTGIGLGYPFEIGGGQFWWRRLTVKFTVDATEADLNQVAAGRLANSLRSVLERLCNSRSQSNADGWLPGSAAEPGGETPILSQVAKSHCWEGGGPDDDFIWRGGVWVQVLTEKP